MFRALLAHSQEALYKRHLVYCVRGMPAGCYQDRSGTESHFNPNAAPPEDEQVMLETCRGQ
jgi:hypothetical protein